MIRQLILRFRMFFPLLLSVAAPLIHGVFLDQVGNETLQLSQLSPKFVRLGHGSSGDTGSTSAIPAWIMANDNYSEIHRFFDSSPFSPSGRYLAVLRIPGGESIPNTKSEIAHIVVYDLKSGPSSARTIASTTAWDSQTGSQVQWGASDDALFYNVRIKDDDTDIDADGGNIKCKGLRGVVHNIFSGVIRSLGCPVYHVSPDGNFAISPDLTKIGFTQLGYGIRSSSASRNRNAPDDHGIYLITVRTGKCRLLSSLHDMAVAGGLDTENTQTYGFHTKFSSDGEMILFVIRTLHRGKRRIKSIFWN